MGWAHNPCCAEDSSAGDSPGPQLETGDDDRMMMVETGDDDRMMMEDSGHRSQEWRLIEDWSWSSVTPPPATTRPSLGYSQHGPQHSPDHH